MVYSVREVIRILEKDGWRLRNQVGAHRHYVHPTKPGLVTVSVHCLGDDVPKGILHAIEAQAGIKFPRR